MVGREYNQLAFVDKLKLEYFGPLAREAGLEKDLIGKVEGKRGRGRCKTRWSDGVKQLMGLPFEDCIGSASDRNN